MYRHPSLQSRKPMPRYNAERRERLFAKHYHSSAFVEFVHKRFGCIVPGCDRRDIEAMHWKSKGAGGTWAEIVPACRAHHAESHDIGIETFATKYGLDFPAASAALIERWEHEESERARRRDALEDAAWEREKQAMGIQGPV